MSDRTIPTIAWVPDPYSDSDDELPKVGDSGYLIEVYDANHGVTTWELRDEPGRTNASGEVRITGWLGTMNNVSLDAHGFVRVTHVGPRVIRVRDMPLVEHDGQQMSHEEVLRELTVELAEAQAEVEKTRVEVEEARQRLAALIQYLSAG